MKNIKKVNSARGHAPHLPPTCFRNRYGRPSAAAFTLVELLVVVAIIGILAALILPAGNLVLRQVQQTKSGANLRTICTAYTNYATSGSRPKTMPRGSVKNGYDWTRRLATTVGLNDASLYLIDGDPETDGAVLPRAVVLDPNDPDSEFAPNFDGAPLGYAVVIGLSTRAPANTPVAWTRGLKADGTWDVASPHEGAGGNIGFVDGHVDWFPRLVDDHGDGVLMKYGTGRPTHNIHEAYLAPSTAGGARGATHWEF